MIIDFTGKTVLVTGGSGGIGSAICQAFADSNATVAIHYNSNKKRAEHTLISLREGSHSIHGADLSNPDEVNKLVQSVSKTHGQIDVVVNNAAVVEQYDFDSLSYDDWQDVWARTIDTNLLGPAYLMYSAAKVMKEKGGGNFVNISSRGAFRGEPKAIAYGASKAGLNTLGQSMAQALAKDNIFVYTIAPGFVATDRVADMIDDSIRTQSPLNRVAEPEEIARTALWLASEGNEFLTGCIVDVNGASYLRS
ncbi:MAG: SDR family oxidoreductase [Candidatus Marinimicrobia bacterium]|nr:SDR family oxidoreductase [Candidatus Neomarinimicrobiota bacterium]MBL7010126.1 SDR family oxidoreductase [Candidatus Neomarinimicrobiota bacterium]MBL7030391.1 SDR family oxidoreductase [Candidatus Neomarinimicrobiota bacterium]